MKLLYLPLNADEFPGGTNIAFKRTFGWDNVRDFDYLGLRRRGVGDVNRLLLEWCDDWKPDVVHMQLQETGVISPSTLERIRAMPHKPVLTTWMGDCRASVPEYTAATSRQCHAVLLSNKGQAPIYAAACGVPIHYWQIGVDWDRDFDLLSKPNPISFKVPLVIFSGRYYGSMFPDSPERLAVVEECARAFPFAVVGSGFPSHIPCLGEHPRDVQRWIYAKAKVSIGVGNFNHVDGFYSERQLCAMASGTPHVCWRVPGLEAEFVDRRDCFMFDSPRDCVEKVHEILANDGMRESIGRNGREAVLRRHTWDYRMIEYREILRNLGFEEVLKR